ncbi:MAG: PadR family transcriptional regulator [Nocardioidaceae bacterium]|nr:PadR family transcriptional regulator [Nocardioidaceae bacterium]
MGHPGFNRQWARETDGAWHQHRGGPWGGGGWPSDWSGWEPSKHGRSGPPPWVAGLFGLAQGMQQRGPRVRRGDVRAAILDVLSTEPMNGYQVISQIAERSGGAWKPSPGSVYPTISQLEDEGLVASDDDAGRRTLRLTDDGRAYVAEHPEELARVWEPFDQPTAETDDPTDFAALKPEIGAMMNAVWQIITTGTDQQRRDAIGILIETRRKLYGLLAEGDAE